MKSERYRVKIAIVEKLSNKRKEIVKKGNIETDNTEIINTTLYRNIEKITEKEIIEYREYIKEKDKK